jgi:hypothetical protein
MPQMGAASALPKCRPAIRDWRCFGARPKSERSRLEGAIILGRSTRFAIPGRVRSGAAARSALGSCVLRSSATAAERWRCAVTRPHFVTINPLGSGYGERVVEPRSLVLLGCRVVGPAVLSPPAERRARCAARALDTGLTNHILACGGKAWRGVRECDALCAFLLEQGVPEHALEREASSHSTRENARYAAALLLPRGLGQIWLVTCDFHMPRALRCFRGAGFEAEPLAASSPPLALGAQLVRSARERVSLALDTLATRGFSRV